MSEDRYSDLTVVCGDCGNALEIIIGEDTLRVEMCVSCKENIRDSAAEDSYSDGRQAGFDDGWDEGKEEGLSVGEERGYARGFDDGKESAQVIICAHRKEL